VVSVVLAATFLVLVNGIPSIITRSTELDNTSTVTVHELQDLDSLVARSTEGKSRGTIFNIVVASSNGVGASVFITSEAVVKTPRTGGPSRETIGDTDTVTASKTVELTVTEKTVVGGIIGSNTGSFMAFRGHDTNTIVIPSRSF